MAEQRSLEINLISAKDLQDVNLVTKMDVYAVVSISGDPNSRQKVKTGVDRRCGTNPTWNFSARFDLDESLLARSDRLTLVVRLVCERSLGDKDVGEVNVPVKELLDSTAGAGDGTGTKFVSYQVRKPSGKPKGELNFSYKFGEKFAGKPAVGGFPAVATPPPPPAVVGYNHAQGPSPVTGYANYQPPVLVQPSLPYGPGGPGYPAQPLGYGYRPPPQVLAPGYGYPPPPQVPTPVYGYGYGYPPPGYGYGYPSAQPPNNNNNNNNKLGLGLGAGLVGGMVGGLLIGDMVSDVASYDAGFADVGGFDF